MLQGLMELDTNILFYVQEHLRIEALNNFVIMFTTLGNAGLIWILIIAAMVLNKPTRHEGKYCIISLILCFILVNIFLKNAVARVRPYDMNEHIHCIIDPQSDYSFPSGHTAIAFAASVPVYFLVDKIIGIVMVVFSVLMGLSRIYVCVHYPSDVIGGALAGILCGMVTSFFIYPHFSGRKGKKDQYKQY